MQRQGILFVISAPSGAGKTTLCKQIIDFSPKLRQSVSFTTRPMRQGEIDGIDYHFVDVERFREMIAADAFVEWAQVHDNYYGTALQTLRQAGDDGQHVLLDIDFQGAAQLKKCADEAVFIFIAPPSLDELERRLRGRATDSDDVIIRRIENARGELQQARWYDYIVVNDNVDEAAAQLIAIMQAEMCRSRFVFPSIEEMLNP
ncbi:MAG: guanylate kinase [Desulfuromonas sp.]|nr:guanylate kinase [Desulfuromonas sp.]